MNFVGEWFGKLVSSEEPDFSDGNTSDNVFNADSNKSETNNGRGSLANILDGFSKIVASVRLSISEHPRIQSMFSDGTVAGNRDTSDELHHRCFSASIAESIKELQERYNEDDKIVGQKLAAKTCETKLPRKPEVDIWKFEKGEKAPSLRRSRANYNLNAMADDKKGPDSIMVVPPVNEVSDCEHSDVENTEPSLMDKIRNNLRSLRMNIAIRRRRHNKREQRKQRADYYRNKYSTNAPEALKASRLIEDEVVSDSGKSKVSRFFDTIRAKCTPRQKTRTELARERVAIKMEQRRQMYKGQSRVQIITHMKGKYKKDN